MSKKRVGIYIDEVVWDVGKDHAWKSKVSLSSYIEELIAKDGLKRRSPITREETKALVEDVIIPEKVYRDTDTPKVRSDDEVLAEAQRKERQRKIAELKNEVLGTGDDKGLRTASEIHFNPQPKNKDKKNVCAATFILDGGK